VQELGAEREGGFEDFPPLPEHEAGRHRHAPGSAADKIEHLAYGVAEAVKAKLEETLGDAESIPEARGSARASAPPAPASARQRPPAPASANTRRTRLIRARLTARPLSLRTTRQVPFISTEELLRVRAEQQRRTHELCAAATEPGAEDKAPAGTSGAAGRA